VSVGGHCIRRRVVLCCAVPCRGRLVPTRVWLYKTELVVVSSDVWLLRWIRLFVVVAAAAAAVTDGSLMSTVSHAAVQSVSRVYWLAAWRSGSVGRRMNQVTLR